MRKIICIIFFVCISVWAYPQDNVIFIEHVLDELCFQSKEARKVHISLKNSLLTYENYKKSFLPTLAYTFSPLSFNRSIKSLQNPEDGVYTYLEDYMNSSSTGISITQKVGITGGSLSINSNLNMLSEFSTKRYSFSSNPFSISYNQELFGGYKDYTYTKRIEFLRNEKTVKDYCKSIADIQHQAVVLYMNLLLSDLSCKSAMVNKSISDTLLQVNKSRYENGYITEQDWLQIKLQAMNSDFDAESSKKEYQSSLRDLLLYLDMPYNEYGIAFPEFRLPEHLDYSQTVAFVEKNNPFSLTIRIKQLQAEQSLYSTKLQNRFNGSVNLSYGVNQYADNFVDAYRSPASSQSVSVGFRIPVFNWGINRNNYKIAKNNYESAAIDIEKETDHFYNSIREQVDDYNFNVELMLISEKAYGLAQMRYRQVSNSFNLGQASIYELTSAQKEELSARDMYHAKLKEVWVGYYDLRSVTLYDFEKKQELTDAIISRI